MNSSNLIKQCTRVLIISLVVSVVTTVRAQVAYKQLPTSKLELTGTSTLHNWEMTSKDLSIQVNFKLNADGTPAELDGLKVSLPAESLKSGKGAMDKNAYNSLKTEQFKSIIFSATSGKFNADKVKLNGNLTISGVTQAIELEATCKEQPDKSLQCKGTKALKMSDYKVEPPTFAFGTVKTGNDININFEVNLSPVKP